MKTWCIDEKGRVFADGKWVAHLLDEVDADGKTLITLRGVRVTTDFEERVRRDHDPEFAKRVADGEHFRTTHSNTERSLTEWEHTNETHRKQEHTR